MSWFDHRKIVVDDSDSRIKYTGQGWFENIQLQDVGLGIAPVFNNTYRTTDTTGSLSFKFTGTAFQVLGIDGPLMDSPLFGMDPLWECIIDGKTIKNHTFTSDKALDNWSFCDGQELSDGTHEVTLNIGSAAQLFSIDQIRYIPSQNASFDKAVSILVENSDSAIIYDSNWEPLASASGWSTNKNGATAKFNFTGTRLTWVGFIANEAIRTPSSASYAIDGGRPTVFPLDTLSVLNPWKFGARQILFSTPELEPGHHSVVVKHLGNDQQTPLSFQFLYFNTFSNFSETPPGPSSSTSLPTDTSSQVAHPTATQSESPVPENHSSVQVKIIIGVVLGGLIFVTFMILFLWWYLRRGKRRRFSASTSIDPYPDSSLPYIITPFAPNHRLTSPTIIANLSSRGTRGALFKPAIATDVQNTEARTRLQEPQMGEEQTVPALRKNRDIWSATGREESPPIYTPN